MTTQNQRNQIATYIQNNVQPTLSRNGEVLSIKGDNGPRMFLEKRGVLTAVGRHFYEAQGRPTATRTSQIDLIGDEQSGQSGLNVATLTPYPVPAARVPGGDPM